MSKRNREYLIDEVDAFIFDFDGVLTNNQVYIDQEGRESVSCSRADGLAFDLLRKLNKPAYIVSTEENPVVLARATKLQIPVLQGVMNKLLSINKLVDDKRFSIARICYLGNDVNDYHIMQKCGITACPADSHAAIKKIANIKLQTKGGEGVVRELLEERFNLNFINVLYGK